MGISEVRDVKEIVTWKLHVTKSRFAKGDSGPSDPEGTHGEDLSISGKDPRKS
jgi:hypothetical protein